MTKYERQLKGDPLCAYSQSRPRSKWGHVYDAAKKLAHTKGLACKNLRARKEANGKYMVWQLNRPAIQVEADCALEAKAKWIEHQLKKNE